MELLNHRSSRLAVWLAAAVLLATGPSEAGEVANEYEVKAAFLCKFASFVEWPDAPSPASSCIGIVGLDPFGRILDDAAAGKFAVRRFGSGQDLTDCRILFVSASEKKRIGAILDRLGSGAILTVGDIPGFCEQGGMINLALDNNRVRLEVNPDAASQARLQLSSKLLSLARLVHHSAQGVRP